MRTYLDPFGHALRRAKEQIAESTRAAQARVTQLHAEATWRLNEAEAHLLGYELAHYWQNMRVPYGARRNASEGFRNNTLEGLPVEHQGDASRLVDIPFGNYEFPVTRYLERVAYRKAVLSNYRVNWLGQYVRK